MRTSVASNKSKESVEEHPVERPLETRTIQQRVFLYIQLNEVSKLPETGYPMELHLYHAKSSLQKMQERYTTETVIYQREFGLKKPVFAMGVMQDDIEDMNTFSDNPLLISLYQRIPRHRKGDSDRAKLSLMGASEASESSTSKKSKKSRKTSKKSSDLWLLGEGKARARTPMWRSTWSCSPGATAICCSSSSDVASSATSLSCCIRRSSARRGGR